MKRKPLKAPAVADAARQAEEIEQRRRATTAPPAQERRKMVTTAIIVPDATFKLLRAAAFARAQRDGGRPSVSALIVELVEDARARLEAEAAD